MRAAIPTLPQYTFMAWCSVKENHRDNFTFSLDGGSAHHKDFTYTRQDNTENHRKHSCTELDSQWSKAMSASDSMATGASHNLNVTGKVSMGLKTLQRRTD